VQLVFAAASECVASGATVSAGGDAAV